MILRGRCFSWPSRLVYRAVNKRRRNGRNKVNNSVTLLCFHGNLTLLPCQLKDRLCQRLDSREANDGEIRNVLTESLYTTGSGRTLSLSVSRCYWSRASANLLMRNKVVLFAGLTVDPSLERYSPKSRERRFRVQGSDTMHALMRRLVTDFQARQPKIAVDLKSGGSAKAIAEFIDPPQPSRIVVGEERAKQVLLVSSSRELLDSEINNLPLPVVMSLAVPIAVDAVALYVHKDNPVTGLTLDQA